MSVVEQLHLFAAAEYVDPEWEAGLDGLDCQDREFVAWAASRWPCKECGGMPLQPDPSLDPDTREADPRVSRYFGADPCLGWLPGVQFACCGHGVDRMAGVTMHGGLSRWGVDALAMLRELGGNPPEPAS